MTEGRGAFSTLSARVVVLSAAMTLAILAIAFTLTYASVARILETETSEVVEAELRGLVDRFREGGAPELAQAIEQRAGIEGDAVYILAGPDDRPIAGNLANWPAGAPLDGSWIKVRLADATTGAAIDVGARAFPVVQDMKLLVGRDLNAQRRFTAALLEAGGIALLLAALLAGAAGFILNRLVMRRIGDVEGAARAIVAGDLSRRIPARPGSDEFSRLAATLNGMLERIEALVTELRAVTDSLAHDLRTPLTRLKTQIARAADGDLAEPTRREALGQAADEADRVLATFSAMIDIARAEAGAARGQFAVTDFAAIVREVFELHQPLAEEMRVTLTCDAPGPASVSGHAQFLAQLVSNLVDNALKHGAGGDVSLRVFTENSAAVLEVADRGPGIPPDKRDLALKRFARLDASRTTPGSGLGLSLAATLARMHNGDLQLMDNEPGLKVRVTIPLAA